MGGFSVYVLLLLVNKVNYFESMTGKNGTRWGRLGCMLGERRAELERSHGAAGDRCWEL